MQIIERDGETREYNVVELFAGVGALSTAMSEKIQEMRDNIRSLIDRIVQAILETFERFFNIDPTSYVAPVAIHYEIVLCVSVKHIVLNFLEHASEVRKQFLLTRHHRGNTDDADFSFSCNLTTAI